MVGVAHFLSIVVRSYSFRCIHFVKEKLTASTISVAQEQPTLSPREIERIYRCCIRLITAEESHIMRNFQPRKQEDDQTSSWYIPLPIECDWGVYARQSTLIQVVKNTQSTEMQTDDLITWLIDRGVMDQRIALFDADLGTSGRLRIDQRTGLQELVERIQADEIKAVLVYQVSRLFRDETGVQYNVFANICKEHRCVLVTSDGMVFNFNNPMHLKMFRYLAEMAAEYIPQQVGLLHAARLRKARKGMYAGLGTVSSGYIVDYRKGSPTPYKFVPYKPHAEDEFSLYQPYYAL